MPILADVYNNTRTWTNRGYTAKEISEIFNENAPLVTGIPIDGLVDVILKRWEEIVPVPAAAERNIRNAAQPGI